MISVQFDYVAPTTLEAAAAQLKQNPNARLLAGGISLVRGMKLRHQAPSIVVDLGKIAGLGGLSREPDGGLRIGAMTTYAEIAASAIIQAEYQALADAIASIGDPQICNRGTIGGSLAHNDPAADLPAVVLALGAVVNTFGADGVRAIPVDELVVGAFKTSLKPAEIITSVVLPAAAVGTGSAYQKLRNPASGFAICGVAAMVSKAADGMVAECRVAVTGAADHAARLRQVEAGLIGVAPTPEAIAAAAGRVAAEGLTLRGGLAASAEYRAHLTEVLAERAIARAVERAG